VRSVLATFGDCTVKKTGGRRVSCGVAPEVENANVPVEPLEQRQTFSYRRLFLIALIVFTAFGLRGNTGKDALLRGQTPTGEVGLDASWLKEEDTNVNISSFTSLRSSSEFEYKGTSYNLANNTISDMSNSPNHTYHQAVFPEYMAHLSNLSTPYNASFETPYFWDVHFSGESVAEAVFSTCIGLTLAAEHGLRQTDYDEEVSFVMTCCLLMYFELHSD
jgi:hypothetical protein